MSLIHGNSKWTDAELRNYLEQAHNSARDKWGAYLSDLSIAYWSAYQTFLKTLNLLEIAAKSNQQNSELFWNVILPAVAGGFIGSIAGSKLREVLENIDTNLRTTISDTAKTVVTDVTKYTTRQVEKAFLDNFQANPWKSDEIEPAKFSEVLKNKILHYLVEVDDVLISAKKSKIPNVYRNTMFILYNSPFIWNAPTEEDLRNWKSNLNKPLEVLLWVRWSTGRDVTYWNKLIQHTMDLNYIDPYGDDVKELNPIFDRLLECGISPSFISFEVEQYGMTPAYAEMFATPRVFNILWVRYLGRHYKDSFLGYLLERINPTSGIVASLPVEFNRRPGSYRLM